MTSIRRFLVIVLLATITLFNFIAALHGYRTSMVKAEVLFDDKLEDTAQMLAYGDYSHSLPVQQNDNSDVAIQIWQNGQLLQHSNNSPDFRITDFTQGFHDASFNNYRWRAYTLFNTNNKQWIIVAERTDLRFALAENIVLTSVLPIVFCLPILGLLIWIIVGRGLKPLISICEALSKKKQNDLSALQFSHTPKELKPVINSTNVYCIA